MNTQEKHFESVHHLLNSQYFGVLATRSTSSGVHTSLVAFTVSEHLDQVFFATPVSSRKYVNVVEHAAVSLLVDNRNNVSSDIITAVAASLNGNAGVLDSSIFEDVQYLFTKKHPDLRDFVQSSTTAMISISVNSIDIVSHFQNVVTLYKNNYNSSWEIGE